MDSVSSAPHRSAVHPSRRVPKVSSRTPTAHTPTIHTPTAHTPTAHAPTTHTPTAHTPTAHTPTIRMPAQAELDKLWNLGTYSTCAMNIISSFFLHFAQALALLSSRRRRQLQQPQQPRLRVSGTKGNPRPQKASKAFSKTDLRRFLRPLLPSPRPC